MPTITETEWLSLTPTTTEIDMLMKTVQGEGQRSEAVTGPHRERPALVVAHGDATSHYEQAKMLEFPMSALQAASLQHAVSETLDHRHDLRRWRQKTAQNISNIAHKCEAASEAIKRNCHSAVRSALGATNIVFVMVLCVAMGWPDDLAASFINGFEATGVIPWSGVYNKQTQLDPLHIETGAALSNDQIHQALSRSAGTIDDDVCKAACEQAIKDGKGGPLTTKEDLDKRYGKDGWRCMKRFVVRQGEGDDEKARACDDARRSGHNACSSVIDKLALPSPFFPSEAAAAFVKASQGAVTADDIETGCEDLKAAYQICPVSPAHHRWNVVAIYDKTSGEPRYQEVWVCLFGTSSSVANYNRIPRFLTQVARTVMGLPMVFYVDDACIVDLASARGQGQRALRTLLDALGWRYAKSQPMSKCSTFLGVTHQLHDDSMTFFPKESFCKKLLDMIHTAEKTNSLTPGEAAKLRGKLAWLTQSVYNHVSRACCSALAAREFLHAEPFFINGQIKRSFNFIKALLRIRPEKTVKLNSRDMKPIIVASDGFDKRGEGIADGPAGLAYLAEDLETGQKWAAHTMVSEEDRLKWRCQLTHIAQVEMAAVVSAIVKNGLAWKGRNVIFFVDNSVTLAAMIKNCSGSPDVDDLAHYAHWHLLQYDISAWFEYIPSKENWADSASRGDFTWAEAHGWTVTEFQLEDWKTIDILAAEAANGHSAAEDSSSSDSSDEQQ